MESINAPKGTKDIYHPEIAKWQYLESMIRSYYAKFQYREIRTPIFEHSELFLRGIGETTEVVQKEMYNFSDLSGRKLTLRPENTASVMRALIENRLAESIYPLRFLYIGPMFRYDKPQKGRFRQFHQFGVEIVGEDTAHTDAELVYSAYDFLLRLGISQVTLAVNSVGCKACRPPYLEHLRQAAQLAEANLCADCQKKATTNPLRIFDCKNEKCIAASQAFPRIVDMLCPACADHFRLFCGCLEKIDVPYTVNSRLVRGLDYYTKTAFEITSEQLGAQNAILGGGRYNDLVKELGGSDLPGIGFAAGMERIVMHLPERPTEEVPLVFVAYQDESLLDEAFRLVHRLWSQGRTAAMDYQPKNLKKQFKKADRSGARFTVILGEEEMASDSLSIKDMKTQQQVSIPAQELDIWLKTNP